MHKIEKRPVVKNDAVVIRPIMYVVPIHEHRIVYGEGAGIIFQCDKTRVIKARVEQDQVHVEVESGGAWETLVFARLLAAVRRRPRTQGLGLKEIGIETDPRTGRVLVEEVHRTSAPSIRAIVNLIPGPMLVHIASAKAEASVESIAGHHDFPQGSTGQTRVVGRQRQTPPSPAVPTHQKPGPAMTTGPEGEGAVNASFRPGSRITGRSITTFSA